MKLIIMPIIVYVTMIFQANQTPNETEKIFSESTILWVKDSINQDSLLIEEFLYETNSMEDSLISNAIEDSIKVAPLQKNNQPIKNKQNTQKTKSGEKIIGALGAVTLGGLFLTGLYRLHPFMQ